MRKHDAWHFFAVYHWSVFVSQIGPQLPLWPGRLDFETQCDLTWTITHVEWTFLLAHCIPSAKWGLFWVWWGSSLTWTRAKFCFGSACSPFLSPFLSKSEGGEAGGVTLLDCSTNTTGWCMRRVSSGKAAILQATSGLARQELCTICTDCLEGRGIRGRGWWAGGGDRYSDRENWDVHFACFNSIKTLETELFRATNTYLFS